MINDLRYAVRMLAKNPGFTAIAVLSLALGIGANTAVFSALNAILLRSLPVREPQALRLINWVGRNPHYPGYNGPGTTGMPGGFTMGTSFSRAAYTALRDSSSGFSDVFAFSSPKSVVVVGHGDPATASAVLVSGNYFAGYGAEPFLGRPIVPQDDQAGAAPVAVITHRWWTQHCGLDPGVVGKAVAINRVDFTVVGILPPSYLGPTAGDSSDIYVPLSTVPHLWPKQPPDQWWLQLMGRLARGSDEAQAQAGLAVAFRQTLGVSTGTLEQGGILLEDGSRGQLILRRQMAKPFLALTAAVALVLLIACANVAGLLLVRGAARQRELAVRAAAGAGRWRLIRAALIESAVLSSPGAALGLVIAGWTKDVLRGVLAAHITERSRLDLRLDVHALAFTVGVSLLTALVFGILPALRASRVDPAQALKSRSALGAPRLRTGKALVALQVGLSLALLMGAGLMVRTFANLARVQPGFDAENVLLFRIRPGDSGYRDERMLDVYERIRAGIATLPGAKEVTFASLQLVSGSASSNFVELQAGDSGSGRKWLTHHLQVGDDFFRTMRIPLLLGRDFGSADNASSRAVAVVSEAFVRRHYPGQNAIGRTFTFHAPEFRRQLEIVGVVRDAKYNTVRAEIAPVLYLSQRQWTSHSASFVVRSVLPPASLLPALRRAVASIDPNLPLSAVRTQKDVLRESVAPDRLFASLGGALALLALLLSCIGLYGVTSYNVARRKQEIGLRAALGAAPGDVAAAILREALLLVVVGITVGLPLAFTAMRLVRSQLFGVAPADPVTLTGGALLLIAVALLSAWIPARRAAKIDPMVALRCE